MEAGAANAIKGYEWRSCYPLSLVCYNTLEIVGNRILILMVDGRAAKKAKINAIWEELNAKEPLPIVKISNSNLQKVIKEKKSTKSVPVSALSLL